MVTRLSHQVRAPSDQPRTRTRAFRARADVRGGGLFNMGTYLLKRDPLALSILKSWLRSQHHGGAQQATWPARQGAFSHDPAVYEAARQHIASFPSGCIAGSPFAPLIAHALGGRIHGAHSAHARPPRAAPPTYHTCVSMWCDSHQTAEARGMRVVLSYSRSADGSFESRFDVEPLHNARSATPTRRADLPPA